MAGTTENLSDRPAVPAGTMPLLWARAASILSILPLGVWTVNHLWDNLSAFSGGAAWEAAVTHHPHPYGRILTWIIVFAPLLIHTIWGVQRLFSFKPNNTRYGYFANIKYIVQRLAAVGVFFFLGAHIYLAMIRPRVLLGHPEQFTEIAAEMHWHTPTLLVYLLGTLGVAYHLANGLSSFAWQWGMVSGRRSLQRFDIVSIVAFFILLSMSWGAIYALWAAGASLEPVQR